MRPVADHSVLSARYVVAWPEEEPPSPRTETAASAPAGSTAAPSQSVASRIASGRSRAKMEARGTAADIRSFRLRSYLVRGGVRVTVTVTVKSEGFGFRV